MYTSAFNKSRSAFPAVAAGLRGKLEGGGGSPELSAVNFDFSVFAGAGVALEVGTGDDADESDSLIFLIGGSFFFNTGSLFSVATVASGPARGEGGFESIAGSESKGRGRFMPVAAGLSIWRESMSSKSALALPFRVRVLDEATARVCGGDEGGSSSPDMSDRQGIESSSSSSSSSEITARRDFLPVFDLLNFAEGSFRRGWGLLDGGGGFLVSNSSAISSSEGLVENLGLSSPISMSKSSSSSGRRDFICRKCLGESSRM